MVRIAGYFIVYFPHRIGEVASEVDALIDEFLELTPKVTVGHAGQKPSRGSYKSDIEAVRREAKVLLDRSRSLGEEDDVFVAFKDGKARDYASETYHFDIFGGNLVYIPSQKTTLPNFVQCFFPSDLGEEQLVRLLGWFESVVDRLDACYAYVNPVVDYDMFHVARETGQILRLLKSNPLLDVFDDFNQQRFFVDHVKSPMWISVLSEAHVERLGQLAASPFCDISTRAGRTHIRIAGNPFVDPIEELLPRYRSLAKNLSPITIDSFDPIMLKFPYKYPHKYSNIWLSRFLSEEWEKCKIKGKE